MTAQEGLRMGVGLRWLRPPPATDIGPYPAMGGSAFSVSGDVSSVWMVFPRAAPDGRERHFQNMPHSGQYGNGRDVVTEAVSRAIVARCGC